MKKFLLPLSILILLGAGCAPEQSPTEPQTMAPDSQMPATSSAMMMASTTAPHMMDHDMGDSMQHNMPRATTTDQMDKPKTPVMTATTTKPVVKTPTPSQATTSVRTPPSTPLPTQPSESEPTPAPVAAVEIRVDGSNFLFAPSSFTVKKGQKVRLTFKNTGGLHDLVIDEFNVATNDLASGEQQTVEFTPDRTGSFEYYCAVGNHRAMGMKGTMIVQ
ncbi:cupredoxin domain-containing protein [Patescibacteria group bacterium]|nr:cupredoxin domain-containing protein [Patescibacteria group bacterium]